MAHGPAPRFPTVRTEGGLLPIDLLARVADTDPTLPGMSPSAYHLLAGERLGEAITRSWTRLVGAWAAFSAALAALPAAEPATALTRERWLLPLFAELGFGRLTPSPAVSVSDRAYPVSHRWGAVPIHLVGARVDLDRPSPGVVGAARMSPHGMVQELLNRSEAHRWAFCANGTLLRILRDTASLTRASYVEFDLEAMMAGEIFADFALLWLVVHESRVEQPPPEPCVLDAWVTESTAQGVRALDRLRDAIRRAIEALGAGFLAHPANGALRAALRAGTLAPIDYYREVLRLAYRIVFLFVAEDRDLLLHPAASVETRQQYHAWYSADRLRRLAERRRGTAHGDLWTSLRLSMAALGQPGGEPALGLPALGGFLWSEDAVPHLQSAELANRVLLTAVRALAFTEGDRVLRRIDYRNLGPEELGAVYESLLELHPELSSDGATFVLRSAAGHERKSTGSYYTPRDLVDQLLRTALDPVLEMTSRAPDPAAAILGLRILDPACGSGHFLLAAAHRVARRLAEVRAPGEEPSPAALRSALRAVISHCLYGIDVEPMALELAKVNLWMAALEPGKPLSFLDHHLAAGDALLGATPALIAAGIPDAAFTALPGDDRPVVARLKKRNRMERAGQETLALEFAPAGLQPYVGVAAAHADALSDDTMEAVRAKRQRWDELDASPDLARARLAADAWCAAFVAPKAPGAVGITQAFVAQAATRPRAALDPTVVAEVDRLTRQYRFLHWHLAFPEVFRIPGPGQPPTNPTTGWSGGFDVVLGNPPWERVKLAEKEFFATRAPAIAETAGAPRRAMIAALVEEDPQLYATYRDALRQADATSLWLRISGRYPLCGRGDVNTYAVFAEAMRAGVASAGRAGIVVPTGIATDDTTKAFFADLVESRSLVSLYDFENRQGLFPDVDSRYKFCLLTVAGRGQPVTEGAEFAFFCHWVADLADPERRFILSADDLTLVNPNTKTCPIFRSRRDAELTLSVYRRVPVLVREGDLAGNPWGVRLTTMFHMTNDSGLFKTHAELEADGWALEGNVFRKDGEAYLPLYEGRMGHQFNHRYATQADGAIASLPVSALVSPDSRVLPQFWVREDLVQERLDRTPHACRSALLGFRRIARDTDERTVIATVLPFGAVSYGWILTLGPESRRLAILLACYNSFAFDYLMRCSLSQPSIPQSTAEQIPVLPPETYDALACWSQSVTVAHWLLPRVLELTYTAWDLKSFAVDLGYAGPPFPWDPTRRANLRAEIDAAFFHLYGLDRDGVAYILDTFPVLRRKEEALFNEYRTHRLILERYDELSPEVLTSRWRSHTQRTV